MEEENKEVSLGTLYDVNKNLIQNAIKALDETALNSKKEIIKNFLRKTNNNYYMLLCNERKDYTIFTIGNVENKEQKIEKLPFVLVDECLKNRGEIRVIELTEDKGAIEAWISANDESFAYYFFPYDSAIINMEDEINE